MSVFLEDIRWFNPRFNYTEIGTIAVFEKCPKPLEFDGFRKIGSHPDFAIVQRVVALLSQTLSPVRAVLNSVGQRPTSAINIFRRLKAYHQRFKAFSLGVLFRRYVGRRGEYAPCPTLLSYALSGLRTYAKAVGYPNFQKVQRGVVLLPWRNITTKAKGVKS